MKAEVSKGAASGASRSPRAVVQGKDIALSFEDVSVSSLDEIDPIVSSVSGYVVKGGITAILGPSASGKSLLMKALCGRVLSLSLSGSVCLKGVEIDVKNDNKFSFVPQEDILIGDFTAREMVTQNALMRLNKTPEEINSTVDKLLKDFGLGHVADNMIGTIFRRGLSGGQKKRVDVGIELVAPPTVLFLDEPTSGLDGSIAFEILSVIRRIVNESKGKLSVILSIHQPNENILRLFDHILLLANDGMMFFGTLDESREYFASIGYPTPKGVSPTDFFLKVTDMNFSSNVTFNFESSYSCSEYAQRTSALIAASRSYGENYIEGLDDEVTPPQEIPKETDALVAKETGKFEFSENTGPTSFWRQTWTLIKREFLLASRDPTMYYLQFALHAFYGFMVGAAFFNLKFNIDDRMGYVPAGLAWIVFCNSYMHVFKVYHLVVHQARTLHENRNNSYTPIAAWVADTVSCAIMLVIYTPGFIFAYFMMDLPVEAFGFNVLNYWMCAIAGESLLALISIFFTDATAAIVTSQALLVILTVFCGVFISWNDMPGYWIWMQESASVTQATRAAYVAVSNYLTYDCHTVNGGVCIGPTGDAFQCIANTISGSFCQVDGREVVLVTQGVGVNESAWTYFGILVAIYAGLRLALLFFMYFHPHEVMSQIKLTLFGVVGRTVMDSQVAIRKLKLQMTHLLVKDSPKSDPLQNQSSSDALKMSVVQGINSADVLHHTPASHPEANHATLTFRNVNVILPNGTKLLDNVSAACKPGRVMALMGPSGAGKTTLLNALSNRAPYAEVTGSIMLGSRPMVPADLMYVPQFDEILPVLTVREQLVLIGELKCKDKNSMYKRLPQLLRILGLYGKRNTRCGELTGGELKRVSVGMGMIVNPNVIFLDEPTTGLDSSAAFSMVEYIVQVAEKTGVVVIMTIHQPSSMIFNMLQDLLLLEGGRTAFTGDSNHARSYFADLGFPCPEGYNPADYYLELIHKPIQKPETAGRIEIPDGASWRSMFESTIGSSALVPTNGEVSVPEVSTVWDQSITNLVFMIKYYFREPGYYFFRLLFLIVIALFVGTMFLRLNPTTKNISNYAGALFFAVWAVLFSAVGSTGLSAAYRRLSINQVQNGVITPIAALGSQFIATLPYNMGCAIVFQCILHWLVDMNPRPEPFFFAVLITWGHLIYMEAIMACVIQVLHDAMLSVIFSMICLGMLFLFPGFFVKVSDIPDWVSWISYIVGTKYSFDGYVYQVYHSQTFTGMGMEFSGDSILDTVFNNRNTNSWGMFGVLVAWTMFFKVVHYCLYYYELHHFVSVGSKKSAAGTTPRQTVPAKTEEKKFVELTNTGSNKAEAV